MTLPAVANKPRPVLVIACGNSLRGDDQTGGRVADALEGDPGFDVRRVPQLTPELAELLAGTRRAVIVDARAGGRLSFRRVRAGGRAPLTHHFTAATLLGLAERLYGRSPETYLLAVPGTAFDLSERMSPGAARGVQAAVRRLRRFLSEV